MGGHAGGADEHAEAVLTGPTGKLRGGGGGAVCAQDVGLIGDAELLKLGTGPFDHRPVGVGAHNDSYLFHKKTLLSCFPAVERIQRRPAAVLRKYSSGRKKSKAACGYRQPEGRL